ncbi:hypothetical protein A3C09_03150 [Candidatus Uhrbacteria bacterium RIFCSPHIGHO2_02_FULL_47_44]|uniref:Prepilin peptidase n=1 Tax=Candidatus Uhrbacteria bacterium RIFCSPLOWO2_02_FULL_48_18 TaxID=1802408 RepID=A0A1F7V7P9_9BACT|nr:MAG: hypothetical protein A3C09_03150 [Candidatus Uhrbacteria bacterium RIFCSPHIGHO2_02_FULL_47_44]OGL80766.1 MAG: hypothetical protein A3B20_05270 [Candidatus Uhrbacteria bacterium RIFCSPLOWO2_01_FULL_47_17]OGL86582.1 MAG: hypothetical protein A3I41_04830 [Candidatus Uhrbacteria bacterium RIFCSPLOWO2_02_FULL_48_18]
MTIFLLVAAGFFIGSFLCLVVDRFGTGQSMVVGRSVCEKCHATLEMIDLIPVLSFLFLHGRCRRCHESISWRYPIIECATALLFGLVAWRLTVPVLLPIGFVPDHAALFLLRDLVFSSLLLVLFLIDIRQGILPDQITLPGILFIAIFNFFLGIPWMTIAVGAVVIGGFFALQFLLSRGKWVGDGDIRFGVLLGVMFGAAQGMLVLACAYIIGALFAAFLIWKKKAQLKSTLSFGPFLAVAGWIVLIFGSYLAEQFLLF